MKYRIIIILSFFIHLTFAEKLNFTTDSTTYLIGQQAKFKLYFEGKEDFNWPTLADTLSKDLEIVEFSKIDTIEPGKYEQILFVTAWDTGYFIVPPIQCGNLQTAPVLLRFNTIPLNPTEDIKPINKQMNTPWIFDELSNLFFASLSGILILSGIIAFIIFQLKNKSSKLETTIPPRPVMDVLWERYYALAKSKIWENGKEKEFQSELSLILRSFLEFKHKVKALEETTGNITIQLNSIGIDKKFRDEVIHILNFSDKVKFAKQKGVYYQHENALNILKKILETHNLELVG